MADELFERGEDQPLRAEPGGVARLRVPQRDQVEMHFAALDEMPTMLRTVHVAGY